MNNQLLELQQELLLSIEERLDSISILLDSLSIIVAILTAIATIITTYIAYVSVVYVKKEYELHKRIRQAEILSSYNERYSTDSHIDKVIRHFHNELGLERLTLNDKEMFLRFFEELQFTIEHEGIPKEIVFDMFAHYALKAAKLGKKFVEDYGDKEWSMFLKFANNMREIESYRKSKRKNVF